MKNAATEEFAYVLIDIEALVRDIPCATVSPCLWLVEVNDTEGVALICVGKWQLQTTEVVELDTPNIPLGITVK